MTESTRYIAFVDDITSLWIAITTTSFGFLFVCPFVCILVRSFVYLFVCLFDCSLARSLARLFAYRPPPPLFNTSFRNWSIETQVMLYDRSNFHLLVVYIVISSNLTAIILFLFVKTIVSCHVRIEQRCSFHLLDRILESCCVKETRLNWNCKSKLVFFYLSTNFLLLIELFELY